MFNYHQSREPAIQFQPTRKSSGLQCNVPKLPNAQCRLCRISQLNLPTNQNTEGAAVQNQPKYTRKHHNLKHSNIPQQLPSRTNNMGHSTPPPKKSPETDRKASQQLRQHPKLQSDFPMHVALPKETLTHPAIQRNLNLLCWE